MILITYAKKTWKYCKTLAEIIYDEISRRVKIIAKKAVNQLRRFKSWVGLKYDNIKSWFKQEDVPNKSE